MQMMDDQYKLVRDYLYDNPNAPIEEVVEETGVQEKIILYYLRDGRLQIAGSSGLLKCEQCGAAINSGRLCEKCMSKVNTRIVQPLQARQAREQAEQRRAELEQDNSRRMYTYKERS